MKKDSLVQMTKRNSPLTALFGSLTLAVAMCGPAAASTVTLTDYNSQVGIFGYINGSTTLSGAEYGGVIAATLDGVALDYVYCTELFVNISLSSYETTTSTNGIIHGYSVANAGQISWLMTNVAPTVGSDREKQAALQAAIWHLSAPSAGGGGISFDLAVDGLATGNSLAVENAYTQYLANSAGQNSFLGNVLWISPLVNGQPYQGLVAANSSVPEPGSLALFSGGLVWLGFTRRRKAS